MSEKVQPIPEGMPAVTPYLTVHDIRGAIEFYQKAFGASDVQQLTSSKGDVLHAEMKIGGSPIMLAEENPEWQNPSPRTLGGTPVRLHLYVADVDETARRAVELGGKLVMPIEDRFYDDRSGRVEDPFGHLWLVSTRIENLSSEEIQRRAEELFG